MRHYRNALENYAAFNGRAGRSEFWFFLLFNFIIFVLLGVLNVFLLHTNLLSNLFTFFILIPTFTVSVRRMHDVGKSGWNLLIPVYSLVLCCFPGDEGDNKYGIDPRSIKEPDPDLLDSDF